MSQARLLNIPIVLVTDSLEQRPARHPEVVVPARRGRAKGVALPGTTLVVLEAMVLGLAATDGRRAVATLERLNDIRAAW
jgi:DNA-binding MurR/RpiR family transcriptional regulator